MRTKLQIVGLVGLMLACQPTEPGDELGGQSGSLKEPPELPDDVDNIDYDNAVTSALAVALAADLATAWRGHMAMMESGDESCPAVFLGAPEDAQTDDDGAISWAGGCGHDGLDYTGFVTWTTEVDAESGTGARSLVGDAEVVNDGGDVRFQFDGDASDSVTWVDGGFDYQTSIEGQVSGLEMYGNSSAVPGGFRGNIEMTTNAQGAVAIDANLYLFGAPLLDRFDSVVLDIEFTEECADEPVGYIGLRGIDGVWFDIYFLPKFAADDPTVEAQAYPYEIIENPTCDGCGHLFVRNIDPETVPLVCPDFGGVFSTVTAPSIDEYVLTLHDPPWENP